VKTNAIRSNASRVKVAIALLAITLPALQGHASAAPAATPDFGRMTTCIGIGNTGIE
jgi:hypothetical protein